MKKLKINLNPSQISMIVSILFLVTSIIQLIMYFLGPILSGEMSSNDLFASLTVSTSINLAVSFLLSLEKFAFFLIISKVLKKFNL